MGTLTNLEKEKMELKNVLKMMESLSREHKIDISARIDAYYRDEFLEKYEDGILAGRQTAFIEQQMEHIKEEMQAG